jgi:hypothetical protein
VVLSTEGYVSATNSLGGNEWCGRGANCVAGTVGGQNTGGGGGGGGASSDEANIDCIDGYSGGSGRVIVWCDKYIVTDTLYNTSLSVSDLSSTHYPLNIQTITNLLLSSTRLGFQTRRGRITLPPRAITWRFTDYFKYRV